MNGSAGPEIVLASTSLYRRELLARVAARFRCVAPAVDEAARSGEAAAQLATRLARDKARAVAARCPGAIVIGSDQTVQLGDEILGKPGDAARAAAQLARASGNAVVFHTAVCIVDGRRQPASERAVLDCTRVQFRALCAPEIARYLTREQPFDCAGSFKAEGLGIALFEKIESQDPTALVGLPLIATCRLLRELGVDVI